MKMLTLPIRNFMISSVPMGIGYSIRNMDMSGFLKRVRISYRIPAPDIGFGPIHTVGRGLPIIPGDGRRSIMGDGILKMIMAGIGFRIIHGDLLGLPGGNVRDIMAGVRSVREFLSNLRSEGVMIPTIGGGLDVTADIWEVGK
jgi:hypothetical protein